MTYEKIILNNEDGLVRLTLNRPTVLNALDEQLVSELYDALDKLGHDDRARVLLITGAGRAFSSGGDLAGGDLRPGEVDAGRFLETHFNPVLERLFSLPIPIVAAVNGAAAGAGCSLALAADITIAAYSAYFLQAFINIGLVPDVGSTWLLPKQIGRARANGMMMLGERIPAETAMEWGMIWKAVPDDRLVEEADEIARRFAAGPTRAYAMTRKAIRNAMEGTLTSTLHEERVNQERAGRTADFAEGVAAFIEKRRAKFTGQ
ncbi:enoyl-CoA hydratase-related protein [Aquisediminimonas sediminicola]|uniref:enoyl-CoA hydratase-related protein n=1 Tax=Alteraquisediminimonas sediminicola TaxID=2676787 RepID=UPI001C8E6E8A|nr:enoyl-CoA hydratase-related protein [Aquisediminimonas sediminicola]